MPLPSPRTLAPLLLLAGCSGVPVDAPLPLLSGDGFFDSPWPSDSRRGPGGLPLMDGFPGRDELPLLETYVSFAEERLDGFSTVAPVYFRLDGPLDTSLLPTPEESVQPGALAFLIDVDPESPHRGERVPIQWDFQEDETHYQPSNLLALAPLWGFPLRPRTTYAAVLLSPLARVSPDFQELWSTGSPGADDWRELRFLLLEQGVDLESVAAATIFTTADPVGGLADFAAYIQEDLGLPSLSQELEPLGSGLGYALYQGWTWLPVFQEGERPYASSGGAFHRDENGWPAVYRWEYARFALSVPDGDPPPGGWPLCLYSHGTGGDYTTFASSLGVLEPAHLLATRGIAGLGIDQPLHGLRGGEGIDPEFYCFNYLNPDSARCTIRQGSLDEIFLAAALHRHPPVFQTERGEVPIDGDHLLFLGHSQGGLVGAMAAPFLGDDLVGMVLSGAGGVLSLSVTDRAEGTDIAGMLHDMLGCDEDEEIDTFHPLVGLVQWLTDATDPVNYAPWWFAEAPPWAGAPVNLHMTEGLLDAYTPHRTAESLAAAARIPVLAPAADWPDSFELRGMPVLEPPLRGDVESWAGPVTAGLAQYPEDGHFAIFENGEAAQRYADFLSSAAATSPPELP